MDSICFSIGLLGVPHSPSAGDLRCVVAYPIRSSGRGEIRYQLWLYRDRIAADISLLGAKDLDQ